MRSVQTHSQRTLDTASGCWTFPHLLLIQSLDSALDSHAPNTGLFLHDPQTLGLVMQHLMKYLCLLFVCADIFSQISLPPCLLVSYYWQGWNIDGNQLLYNNHKDRLVATGTCCPSVKISPRLLMPEQAQAGINDNFYISRFQWAWSSMWGFLS